MWKADTQSKEDRAAGILPELTGSLPNLANYQNVVIGGPVWGGQLANPLVSYLDKVDFQNRKVTAFWTFMDYEGKYEKDFKDKCKNAQIIPGLPITVSQMRNPDFEKKLEQWTLTWNQ